ncbi:MAG: putative DNA binding protein [Halobacteriales archaeon]|jgi:predicted DNA binding protein
MGVTATVELPRDTCSLGRALRGHPDSRIHVERIVPAGGAYLPYFWTDAATVQGVAEKLEEAPAVDACAVVDVVDDEALVRVEWLDPSVDFLEIVHDTGGAVLEAICTRTGWTVTLRFDDHADLGRCYRTCIGDGIQVTVTSVRGPTSPRHEDPASALTARQRRTLFEAYERGYFEVPRQTELADLAGDMGVSDTAVSQRLRRGTAALVEKVLVEAEETAGGE